MYKIVTKEDTIRIPAEYMRKGQSLDQHIDRLSMTAFEGRFDDDNRFVLVTTNHQPLGRGRIIHGDGAIYQRVRFDAVLFCCLLYTSPSPRDCLLSRMPSSA